MGQTTAKTVTPDKAGALLNACEQLWKEMKFNLAHPKKYQHLRYLAHTKRERGDFSLWWCFSSVVLLCEVATRRKIVIPALKGVVCIFAVVLAGNVFLSAGGETFLWKEGTGNVFCPADPDTPLCVEVEGSSTALVLAYMVESDVGPGFSQAKKRAALFVNAKSEAKQQWGGPYQAGREEAPQRCCGWSVAGVRGASLGGGRHHEGGGGARAQGDDGAKPPATERFQQLGIPMAGGKPNDPSAGGGLQRAIRGNKIAVGSFREVMARAMAPDSLGL